MTEPMELTREEVEEIDDSLRFARRHGHRSITIPLSAYEKLAAALRDIESRDRTEGECSCPQCWDSFGNPVDIHMASCTKAATPQPAGDAEELVERLIAWVPSPGEDALTLLHKDAVARIESDQARIRELERAHIAGEREKQVNVMRCPYCKGYFSSDGEQFGGCEPQADRGGERQSVTIEDCEPWAASPGDEWKNDITGHTVEELIGLLGSLADASDKCDISYSETAFISRGAISAIRSLADAKAELEKRNGEIIEHYEALGDEFDKETVSLRTRIATLEEENARLRKALIGLWEETTDSGHKEHFLTDETRSLIRCALHPETAEGAK